MKIEENLRLSLLMDMYGSLLTKKQKDILGDFLNNNLSLSELAEIHKTTRQAVNDLVKRTEKVLEGYEVKLHLLKKFEKVKSLISKSLVEVEKENFDKDKVKSNLNLVLEVL